MSQSLNIDTLIDEYSDTLYHFCRHLSSSKEDADDLFQETWIKVMRKLHQYDQNQSFKNWLYKIALNHYRDRYRKYKKILSSMALYKSQEEVDIAINSIPSYRDQPENDLMQQEVYKALHIAVSNLKDTYRLPIVMYYFNELSQKEISVLLDIPEGTVKSRLFKGKKMLTEVMEESGHGSIGYNVT